MVLKFYGERSRERENKKYIHGWLNVQTLLSNTFSNDNIALTPYSPYDPQYVIWKLMARCQKSVADLHINIVYHGKYRAVMYETGRAKVYFKNL